MRSSAELLAPLEMFGTRLGLDSTRRLLGALGDPQSRLAVVLVGGTNGKGSTAALLAAIASAAGYRTGLYTSPHLEHVHERIRLDGRSISETELVECLTRVAAAADRLAETPVTYFEALTAGALVHFAGRGVELALLEVGLGGRLDATNACEPVLSLITEIGLDHRDHLGHTLREIAVEKAGILRPDRPAVGWVSEGEARRAIESVAEQVGAHVRFACDDCEVVELGESPAGHDPAARPRARVELTTAVDRYRLAPALAGGHQLSNVALAVAAAEELASAGWSRLGRRAVETGVAACRWPGRLEWVCPSASEARFLLDGAHNPAAIASLERFLSRELEGFTLIFGALRDKELDRMLPPLAAAARRVVVTAPATSRAIEPEALAALIPERAPEVVPGAAAAVAATLDSPEPVVVTGSLYLVGEVRAELTRRFGVPEPAPALSTFDPAARP